MTTNAIGESGLRWQGTALLALQEAAEAYLVHLFEDALVPYRFFCAEVELTE
jgi:histone H3/H4